MQNFITVAKSSLIKPNIKKNCDKTLCRNKNYSNVTTTLF